MHDSPARALYAAMLAPMFPVDATTTAFALSFTAWLISMVLPLSLKLPVGLHDSSLNRIFLCLLGTRGVPPSPRLTSGWTG